MGLRIFCFVLFGKISRRFLTYSSAKIDRTFMDLYEGIHGVFRGAILRVLVRF